MLNNRIVRIKSTETLRCNALWTMWACPSHPMRIQRADPPDLGGHAIRKVNRVRQELSFWNANEKVKICRIVGTQKCHLHVDALLSEAVKHVQPDSHSHLAILFDLLVNRFLKETVGLPASCRPAFIESREHDVGIGPTCR